MPRALSAAVGAAILSSLLLATSVLAAPPTKVDLDDPELEAAISALLTDACGFPVTTDIEGHIIIRTFEQESGRGRAPLELNVFRTLIYFTNVETGSTTRLVDAGPDRYWVNADGDLMLSLVGQSTTGSGVIGHTIVNLDTGEIEFVAGREAGDWIENVCAALAPAE